MEGGWRHPIPLRYYRLGLGYLVLRDKNLQCQWSYPTGDYCCLGRKEPGPCGGGKGPLPTGLGQVVAACR